MTAAQFLVEWTVRSTIVMVSGAVLLRALRVKSASVKLGAWTAMLFASLSIPVLMTALPSLPLRIVVPRPQPAIAPILAAPSTLSLNSITQRRSASELPARLPRSVLKTINWRRVALGSYACVAGILLLRLFVGLGMARRLARGGIAIDLKHEGLQIRESNDLTSPATMGFSRPIILLPPDWRGWDSATLHAVLAHEAAHVQRRDPLVQALSAAHRALLWLSPMSWVLHRQLIRLAEEASDEAAVAATHDRCSYAEVLLSFMQRGVHTSWASWHGAAMARYQRPEVRITRILNASGFSRGVTRSGAALILAVAAPLACLVATGRVEAAQVSAANTALLVQSAQPVPAQSDNSNPSVAVKPAASQTSSAKPAHATTAAPAKADTPPASTTPQAAVAGQSSERIERYLIVDGTSVSGSWDTRDTDVENIRGKFGRHFAWLRVNGREYVITDPGVLEEFRAANAPQEEVNRMQADVNAHQAGVNELQSQVNAMQNKVNELQNQVNVRQDIANRIQSSVNQDDKEALAKKLEQSAADVRAGRADADQNTVNREQAKVNEAQHNVNAKQSEVNQMQQKVNEQQQQVNVEYRRRVQEIFQSAMSRGLAQQLM